MNLYINSCVRKDSRTNRLAKALIDKLGEDFYEINLDSLKLKPLSEEQLEKRTLLLQKGDLDDEMFKLSKMFASADKIVISAPYWDGSFPSALKVFIENIYCIGIVSKYADNGMPIGLCKASNLYYVVTAGGYYDQRYSYDYIETLAKMCFGISQIHLIKAECLDIIGNVAEDILNEAINNL